MLEIFFSNDDSLKHPESHPLMELLIPQPDAVNRLTQYGLLFDKGLTLEEMNSMYDYAFHTRTYATFPNVIADMMVEDLEKMTKVNSVEKEMLSQKLGLQIIGLIVMLSPRIKIHQTARMLFLATQEANVMHMFDGRDDFRNAAEFLGSCLRRADSFLTQTHSSSRAREIIQTIKSFFRDHISDDQDRLRFDSVFNKGESINRITSDQNRSIQTIQIPSLHQPIVVSLN